MTGSDHHRRPGIDVNYHTLPQLAALAGVHEKTVLKEIRRGCLQAWEREPGQFRSVRRRLVVDKDEAARWLEFYVRWSQDHEAHRERRRADMQRALGAPPGAPPGAPGEEDTR